MIFYLGVLKPKDDGSWLYFNSSSFLFTLPHCLTCIVNIFSPEGLVQYHRTILKNLELRIGRSLKNDFRVWCFSSEMQSHIRCMTIRGEMIKMSFQV